MEQLQHLTWIAILIMTIVACSLVTVIGIYAAAKTLRDDWRDRKYRG